jgi:hypothetical protein
MTPVKPQISKFQTDKKFAKWALTCYGGSTHERLLRFVCLQTLAFRCTYSHDLYLFETLSVKVRGSDSSGREGLYPLYLR